MQSSVLGGNDCFSPKVSLHTWHKSNIHSNLETLISLFTILCSPIWHSQYPRCIWASKGDLQNTCGCKTRAAGHRQSLSTLVENALVLTEPAVLICNRMRLLSRCEIQHPSRAARQLVVEISNKRRLTPWHCAKRFHFLLLCRWVSGNSSLLNVSTWVRLSVFVFEMQWTLSSAQGVHFLRLVQDSGLTTAPFGPEGSTSTYTQQNGWKVHI